MASEIVDMGIARIEELRKIENPNFPIRSILAQPDYGFEWVAWVEGSGHRFGWCRFSDALVERAAMNERRVFEFVIEDAIRAMPNPQPDG